MERRKNIMMDVTPNPVPVEEVVEEIEEEPKPTESDIFKGVSVAIKEVVEDQEVPKKKDKRECTPKMKLHMDKMRIKAAERKAQLVKLKEMEIIEKYKATLEQKKSRPVKLAAVKEEEEDEVEAIRPPIKEKKKAYTNLNEDIDYDRIITGVTHKFQQKHKEERERAEWEQKIRNDENEKSKKYYGELYTKAATDFKKKTYQGYGKGFGGKSVHPVFGNSYAYDPKQSNPFDKCFN
tara:strand:- start:184 stop:891 length:708 start_codon:yes stop_codon:yes gene_type:complete